LPASKTLFFKVHFLSEGSSDFLVETFSAFSDFLDEFSLELVVSKVSSNDFSNADCVINTIPKATAEKMTPNQAISFLCLRFIIKATIPSIKPMIAITAAILLINGIQENTNATTPKTIEIIPKTRFSCGLSIRNILLKQLLT